MAKGGARARSGPPPDPTALSRERDIGEWSVLPEGGRVGPTPEWPLTEQTLREASLWEKLWRKPQALMWERYGQEYEVALYVRRLSEAELIDSPVTLTTLVKQMSDSLGLTTPGMRANRWRILREGQAAPTALAGSRAGSSTPGGRASSKSRLTVVRPAAGDGE